MHRTEDLGWLHDGQRLFVCDPHRLFMWPPYEVDSIEEGFCMSILNSVCSTQSHPVHADWHQVSSVLRYVVERFHYALLCCPCHYIYRPLAIMLAALPKPELVLHPFRNLSPIATAARIDLQHPPPPPGVSGGIQLEVLSHDPVVFYIR